jgi:fructose-bisphosphate aldolase class I
MPIIEPEVNIKSADRPQSDLILRDEILKALNNVSGDHKVMLKLSIPAEAGTFDGLINHPRVLRVVALSGGYARPEACAELAKNKGMIASFSRALLEDLRHKMTADEFDAALASAIDEIYAASAT